MIASDTSLLIASWLATVGTLVLAGVTTYLATSTRSAAKATVDAATQAARSADAAERDLMQGQELLKVGQSQTEAAQAQVAAAQVQAEAATATFAAASRPILVPATGDEPGAGTEKEFVCWDHATVGTTPSVASWWMSDTDKTAWVVVRIRNVGSGPAVIGRGIKDVFLRTMFGGDVPGWTATLVIAPQDCVDVTFADPRTHTEHAGCLAAMFEQAQSSVETTGARVTVVLRYVDIGGVSMPASHLSFRLRADGRVDQRGVELGDEPTPA